MDIEKAKTRIRQLVDEFETANKNMSEIQLRSQFVDPLFDALGWNMRTEAIREETILKGRADYIFRLANKNMFVLETKKPSVNLDEKVAAQAVSYAWHNNIKWAIITNFKELRIYHALNNPKHANDNLIYNNKLGYLKVECNEFISKFKILHLLSREKIKEGELDLLVPEKDVRISRSVDEAILNDLLLYREWLTKDIKKYNLDLKKEQMDEAVQHVINRLIFIRSTEDRELEDKDMLLGLVKNYERKQAPLKFSVTIKNVFKEFDKTYNSKLFDTNHFLDTKIVISDHVLINIIKDLYFGTDGSRKKYEFDLIPVDLLGKIYEQYLGVILRDTEKRVKLKKEISKRKKMGIYYTPQYIVDYIVGKTVGKASAKKSLDEITKLRVLDPACGSGSFLQSAFSFLHEEIKDKIKRGEKSIQSVFNFNIKDEKLNLGQKIQMMVNNIYGVDLDEKAVEIAHLSLLLKLLEGENKNTRKRLLPALTDNIKLGNSLISDLDITDYAFNWKANFPRIFNNGGFDAIIGNPPYVDSEEMTRSQPGLRGEYTKAFESAKGNWDLFCLFVEQGIKLLRDDGYFGMIIPNKILSADYAKALRDFINQYRIISIRDYSEIPVFAASVYPIVIIIQKSKPQNNTILIEIMKDIDGEVQVLQSQELLQSSLEGKATWSFMLETGNDVLDKIESNSVKLETLCNVSGASTVSEAYEIKHLLTQLGNQKDFFKFINTGTIDRYSSLWDIKPTTYIKDKYEKPIILKGKLQKFSKNRFLQASEKKIIIAGMAKKLECYYDKGDFLAGKSTTIIMSDEINLKVLLGILNSKLMTFCYKKMFKSLSLAGGFMRVGTPQIKQLPIKMGTSEQGNKIQNLVERIINLSEKLNTSLEGSEKDRLKQQIKQTDFEINEIVYEIYNISEAEKKTIEENSK